MGRLRFVDREKVQQTRFGPKAIISPVSRYERAMAPVLGRGQADMRIARQRGIGKTPKGDEGIILRRHDHCGNHDFLHDAQGAGLRVVIHGVTKAAIFRGDLVIEFAQRANAGQKAEIEFPGKKFRFAPHPIFQVPHEVLLIDKISRQADCICAYAQVHAGAHGSDR